MTWFDIDEHQRTLTKRNETVRVRPLARNQHPHRMKFALKSRTVCLFFWGDNRYTMNIYIYTHMYNCIHICIQYVYIYIHTHSHMYEHMWNCMNIYQDPSHVWGGFCFMCPFQQSWEHRLKNVKVLHRSISYCLKLLLSHPGKVFQMFKPGY